MNAAKLVESILQCGEHELYKVLDVDREASPAAVHRAYLRRARDTHPDKNLAPLAADAFKRLSHAASVLSDPELRAAHDAKAAANSSGARAKRRPFERRASEARKRKKHTQDAAATKGHSKGDDHAAPDSLEDDCSSDAASAGSSTGMGANIWCSWQERDVPHMSSAAGQGAEQKRNKPSRSRRAANKAAQASQAAAGGRRGAVGFRSGGGEGRGHLGKRPWRRAARLAAKKAAKEAKARSKARQHLQT